MPHATGNGHGFIHLRLHDVAKGLDHLAAQKANRPANANAWIAQYSRMQDERNLGNAGTDVIVECHTNEAQGSANAHHAMNGLMTALTAARAAPTGTALFWVVSHWCCFSDY